MCRASNSDRSDRIATRRSAADGLTNYYSVVFIRYNYHTTISALSSLVTSFTSRQETSTTNTAYKIWKWPKEVLCLRILLVILDSIIAPSAEATRPF